VPRTLVTPEMRAKATTQRRFATKGETLLWYELRDLRPEGLKFRRQSPIGPYVADFVCFDPKVVVEVDGDHHETGKGKRHDANRDAYLKESGFLVLRYDASDALDRAWHIAQDVKSKAGALPRLPHPRPSAGSSPQGGGGSPRKLLSPLAGEMSAKPTEGVIAEGTADRSSTAAPTPPGSLREPPSPQGGGEGRRPPITSTTRIARRAAGTSAAARMVPEETPIALSYAGTTHAVMMGSPADFEDFALGFSLTEGIISSPEEIESIEVEDLGAGIDIQIKLKDTANTRFQARRRRLAGPVGCGLCGIESIEEAMRLVDDVGQSTLTLSPSDIVRSVKLLSKHQPLHAETGAVHAAGFYVPGKGVVAAREDVGRHNALDKLAGALARAGVDGASGAVVVTSRVSVEMVQKTAAIGASFIIAVSAPTALAIRTAEGAGMTLVALVRGDEFDIFTHPDRVTDGAAKNVA
jgi:FdhD protein